jgi:hypothetical protein
MPEPFSFVVRAGETQLARALDDYIAANAATYGGGSGTCPAWGASVPGGV